jgi:hypothetical protein
MARSSCLAAVLLAACSVPSIALADPSTAIAGKLRWVRAEVVAVSGETLTLQLRSKPLTIALAGVAQPAVGAIVEAHYTDKHGERRAVLIFDADRGSKLSRRPGTSFRGVVARVKHNRLSLTADTKSHAIELVKKTRLVDADGHAVATGSKAAGLLPAGEDVIVKYEDDGGAMMVGDMMMAAGSDQALEIRRLR